MINGKLVCRGCFLTLTSRRPFSGTGFSQCFEAFRRLESVELSPIFSSDNSSKYSQPPIPMNDRGVIYISTGDKYYAEALISIKSLKEANPDLPVTIFTDARIVDPIFDNVVVIESPTYSVQDKSLNIWKTPYSETLYLDSDTFVTGVLEEYFDVLQYCDFAGTIETARGFWYQGEIALPQALCDINGGVLCFKKTPAVIGVLQAWYAEFKKTAVWLKKYGSDQWTHTNDQPSLRQLIWTNREIRVAILPDEYNALRFFGTRLWGHARIVHGRGNISLIANEMNAAEGCNRVYLQGAGTIRPLQEIGLWDGLKQCLKMLMAIFLFKLKIHDHAIYKKVRNRIG